MTTLKSGSIAPLRDLSVKYQPVEVLQLRDGNPRTHSRQQLRQLKRLITTVGFTTPILVDEHNRVIAGHGRLEAAKLAGLTSVPTICLEGMSESEIRAYVIADNRIAEKAGWDPDLLAVEFDYLTSIDLDFDATITGFEVAEIDLLLNSKDAVAGREEEDATAAMPAVDPTRASVVRSGDVWTIGEHRLLCDDSLESSSLERLLDGGRAAMVFSDPPYNVPINGHVSGLGKTKHREFAMASGEMSEPKFRQFLATNLGHVSSCLKNGSILFVCMDWRHAEVLQSAARDVGLTQLNLCVWVKNNGGMGAFYRSQHELVFVFKVGTAPHVNNIELGRHGRYRTNVWSYPGVNTFGADRDATLAMHPTVKPVGLVGDAILDASRRNDIILDPFAGSGTTLVAAHRTGRRGFGIEIDPHYCEVILRRLQTVAKEDPLLLATGQVLSEVEADRTALSGQTEARQS